MLGDISEPICYDGDIDYVIHGASPTSSKYFVSHPVETIGAAVDGTRYVLELAKQKQVKGVVYLSSLEVYGTPAEDAGMITEKDYGYIEPLSVRSSYSEESVSLSVCVHLMRKNTMFGQSCQIIADFWSRRSLR